MTAMDLRAAAYGVPRHKIEKAIQNLIDLLDATEPDPDLEPVGDDEPSLGWTSTMAFGDSEDREDDFDSGIADPAGALEQGWLCTPIMGGGHFE